MTREQLEHKLKEKFGVVECYKKYTQIKELLEYTYGNVGKCGFALDFYDKIFDLL